MRKLLLFALLLLALQAAALAAPPDSLSLPEFAARLEGAAAAVDQNHAGEVRQLFADRVTVAAPGGSVAVDMRWATVHLTGSSLPVTERTRLAEQLRAMAREARAVERTGQPGLDARLRDAATDRQRLEQILRVPEPPPTPAWVRSLEAWLSAARRQWDRLAQWWGRQWSWVPELPGLPAGSGRKLVSVAAAAALLLLGGGCYWLWVKRRRRKGASLQPSPALPADMRRAALAAAESGDLRAAIKLLMQAVIGRLADRSLIEWQPFLTNRGCVSELRRRRPELALALDELNGLYEWKIYGGRPVTKAEFRHGMALADRLWEEGSPSVAS